MMHLKLKLGANQRQAMRLLAIRKIKDCRLRRPARDAMRGLAQAGLVILSDGEWMLSIKGLSWIRYGKSMWDVIDQDCPS